MKQLLLVGINSRYSHSTPALYSLKAFCSDLDWKIHIHETTTRVNPMDLMQVIRDINPQVLGFSVYIWNHTFLKNFLPQVKQELPALPVILGGPEAGYLQDTWQDLSDFIITGPGEASLHHLLSHNLQVPRTTISLPNLPFNELSFLYTEEDLQRFSNRYIYYESSRGCPYRCTYCLSSRDDIPVEYRHLDQVFQELNAIMSVQPGTVKFIDRTFNLNRNHYLPIWEHIIRTWGTSKTRFHFEIQPDRLDEQDFRLLNNLPEGLFQFEAGIQSTNAHVLHNVHRKMKINKALENLKRIASMKSIHLHVDQIVGLPGENFTQAVDSFNSIYSIGACHFQVGFLKVLPGTFLEEQVEEYGIVHESKPPYTVLETGSLSKGELSRFKLVEDLVDRLHNSGRFTTVLKELVVLFNNPFDCYSDMSAFVEKNPHTLPTQWDSLGKLLLMYINESHPGTKDFLLDCLRWDWFLSINDHRMPGFLQSDQLHHRKKHFLNNPDLYTPARDQSNITSQDKIMTPETGRFASMYMETADFAVLYQEQEKPVLYYQKNSTAG